ncbi:MAG: GNAT family N-acetyltransferase [Saprospiraceae bacterium]
MNIQFSKVKLDKKPILRNLLSEYLIEMNLNDDYPYFDNYWIEKNRTPLIIQSNNRIIGFVLINDFILNHDFQADKSIAEFYIKPDFRRKGIGRKVAFQLFKTYQGKWEIRQQLDNQTAQLFWLQVISEFTDGNFTDGTIENKNYKTRIQIFKS